jgi:hypothetical protein
MGNIEGYCTDIHKRMSLGLVVHVPHVGTSVQIQLQATPKTKRKRL